MDMGGMMDEGSYGKSESQTQPKESAESVDEEADTEQTAIVPNHVLSPEGEPLKEGDEVVLKVVKNYGDECEVKYAPKESPEEGSESSEPPEAAEIAALDTESNNYGTD